METEVINIKKEELIAFECKIISKNRFSAFIILLSDIRLPEEWLNNKKMAKKREWVINEEIAREESHL